jgi:hypothetical protein
MTKTELLALADALTDYSGNPMLRNEYADAMFKAAVALREYAGTMESIKSAIDSAREEGFRDGREFETHPPSFEGSAIASLTTQVSIMEGYRKKTRDLLQSLVSSSVEIVNGEEVIGYQIKTGALHKLVGLYQGVDAVYFPSNLPTAALREYAGMLDSEPVTPSTDEAAHGITAQEKK